MRTEKDLRECSDDELFQMLQKSDKDAMVTIFDRYSPRLYLHVFNKIRPYASKGQVEDDTKNVLIYVFASLWNNHNLIPSDISFADYLFASVYYWVEAYIYNKGGHNFN